MLLFLQYFEKTLQSSLLYFFKQLSSSISYLHCTFQAFLIEMDIQHCLVQTRIKKIYLELNPTITSLIFFSIFLELFYQCHVKLSIRSKSSPSLIRSHWCALLSSLQSVWMDFRRTFQSVSLNLHLTWLLKTIISILWIRDMHSFFLSSSNHDLNGFLC